MDPVSPDTDGLAARIAKGDPAAEAELVERYRPGLLIVLRNRVRPRQLAEDLCQEALRVAIETLRRDGVRRPESLPGFLRGVARNLARHERRRTWRLVALDLQPPRPTRASDPERAAVAEERERLMAAALARLAERDRELLRGFYLGGEDKGDLCRRLELTPGQFDVVKFRALRRFRRLWLEHAPDRIEPRAAPNQERRGGPPERN